MFFLILTQRGVPSHYIHKYTCLTLAWTCRGVTSGSLYYITGPVCVPDCVIHTMLDSAGDHCIFPVWRHKTLILSLEFTAWVWQALLTILPFDKQYCLKGWAMHRVTSVMKVTWHSHTSTPPEQHTLSWHCRSKQEKTLTRTHAPLPKHTSHSYFFFPTSLFFFLACHTCIASIKDIMYKKTWYKDYIIIVEFSLLDSD